MKKILSLAFASVFFSSNIILACPYQSMVEIDNKLKSATIELSAEKMSRINELRLKGEEVLKSGDIEESEKILNNALALFN